MVQTRHTTTGLLVNEHEPLLLADFGAMFERLAPTGRLRPRRLHPAGGACSPASGGNGHAHCRAALLRASESVAVSGGALGLGRWQRILFVECDGGQRRQVSVTCVGIARTGPPVRLRVGRGGRGRARGQRVGSSG